MHVDYNGTVIWYDILSGNESSLYRVWASDGLYQISYGPASWHSSKIDTQTDGQTYKQTEGYGMTKRLIWIQ